MSQRVRNLSTGEVGTVVRGPYTKYRAEWFDVVFPNPETGTGGRYSRRVEARNVEPVEEG
jgi:hypothetical protein